MGRPSVSLVALEKSCSKCAEAKSYVDFYKYKGRLTSQCKKCTDVRLKAYHAKNPNARTQFKTREYQMDANYKRSYGISLSDAKDMLDMQNGLCANGTCGQNITLGKKTTRASTIGVAFVDHCHTTGKVRGLLCMTCNTCLGHLERKNRVTGLEDYMRRNGQELFN